MGVLAGVAYPRYFLAQETLNTIQFMIKGQPTMAHTIHFEWELPETLVNLVLKNEGCSPRNASTPRSSIGFGCKRFRGEKGPSCWACLIASFCSCCLNIRFPSLTIPTDGWPRNSTHSSTLPHRPDRGGHRRQRSAHSSLDGSSVPLAPTSLPARIVHTPASAGPQLAPGHAVQIDPAPGPDQTLLGFSFLHGVHFLLKHRRKGSRTEEDG